ncbi:SCF ubiquitin ligase complex subunit cdc4, partial [Tulasnella sp. 403]
SGVQQALPHPYKTLFKSRFAAWNRWAFGKPKETRVCWTQDLDDSPPPLRLFRGLVVGLSNDYTISTYSLSGLQQVKLFKGHSGFVEALDVCSRRRIAAMSLTDTRVDENHPQTYYHDVLVSGSDDCTVRIWDLQTQKNTHTFTGHRRGVSCLAVAKPVWVEGDDRSGMKEKWPKHHMLVSGSWDGTLMVWRVPGLNGIEYHGAKQDESVLDNPYYVRTLRGHLYGVTSVAAHGRIVASGSDDMTVRIWDLVTGECRRTLVGHTDNVLSVALDPVRKIVASGSLYCVRIWSLESGATLGILDDPKFQLTGDVSLSTNTIVSASFSGNLISRNLTHLDAPIRKLRYADEPTEYAHDAYFHLDDDRIVSGNEQELKIWDTQVELVDHKAPGAVGDQLPGMGKKTGLLFLPAGGFRVDTTPDKKRGNGVML